MHRIGSALIVVGALACGGPVAPTPTPVPAPVSHAPAEDDRHGEDAAPTTAAFVPEGPHLENCVLHAGSGRGRRGPDGAIVEGWCSYNAECTANPGTGMTGDTDGFIYLTCEGGACECIVEGGAEGSVRHRTPFEIDAPCATADHAEALFMDYCMAGSYLYEE